MICSRVEAEARQLAIQPAAAVRHRARLADDHARLERIEDVEEVAELGRRTISRSLATFSRPLMSVSRVMIATMRMSTRVVRVRKRLDVSYSFSYGSVYVGMSATCQSWRGSGNRLVQARPGAPGVASRRRDGRSSRRPPRAASLLPGGIEFGFTRRRTAVDQPGQLVEPAARIRQREGPLPPVDWPRRAGSAGTRWPR